jgi:hypothetical protein
VSGGFVFVVYEAGHHRLGLDFALDMRRRGKGPTVLFSPYFLPDTAAYVAQGREVGIPYVHECTELGGWADPWAQLGQPPAEAPPPAPVRHSVLRRARLALAGRFLEDREADVGGWQSHYGERLGLAARFLAATGARSIVLPEDNVERDSACWIRAAQAIGGRSTILSYAVPSPHEAAVTYYDNPDHAVRRKGDLTFALLFPRWFTRHRGRALLRLPAARALAMERLGLAPDNPWVVNTGAVDALAVESEYVRGLFVRQGIPARRVHATGHAALDRLAEAAGRREDIRRAWQSEHGLEPGRPVVLCAIPPDQYPGVAAPEYENFAALLDGWLEVLEGQRPALFPVLSPHPAIGPAHVERMRGAGMPVLEGGVAPWLAACDVYVASVSSTIKWALACGKPTVNYDCYDYRYADFEGLGGVTHVGTREQFRAALERFRDAAYLLSRTGEVRAQSTRFGVLDGRSGDRVAGLVSAT